MTFLPLSRSLLVAPDFLVPLSLSLSPTRRYDVKKTHKLKERDLYTANKKAKGAKDPLSNKEKSLEERREKRKSKQAFGICFGVGRKVGGMRYAKRMGRRSEWDGLGR